MTALGKRVKRLEGAGADHGAVVWVQAPADWPAERSRAEAEALAGRRGLRPPFGLTVWPRADATAMQPLFVGTGAEFGAMLADVAARGKRVGGGSR